VYSVNVGGRASAANIYFVAIQQLPFQAGHAWSRVFDADSRLQIQTILQVKDQSQAKWRLQNSAKKSQNDLETSSRQMTSSSQNVHFPLFTRSHSG